MVWCWWQMMNDEVDGMKQEDYSGDWVMYNGHCTVVSVFKAALITPLSAQEVRLRSTLPIRGRTDRFPTCRLCPSSYRAHLCDYLPRAYRPSAPPAVCIPVTSLDWDGSTESTNGHPSCCWWRWSVRPSLAWPVRGLWCRQPQHSADTTQGVSCTVSGTLHWTGPSPTWLAEWSASDHRCTVKNVQIKIKNIKNVKKRDNFFKSFCKRWI